MTYYVPADRNQLVGCLPEGAVGAEVGVFADDFVATILAGAKPRELHMIDAWRFVGYDWRNPPAHVPESQHAAIMRYLKSAVPAWETEDPSDGLAMLYDRVRERFAGDDRVRVARGLSGEVLASYPEESFDFLYLDADHDYHSVLSDLWAAARILKPGGLQLGRDFDMDRRNRYSNHNVIEAVLSFCTNSGFRMIALSADLGSTFVLARAQSSPMLSGFVQRLIGRSWSIVEIPQEIVRNHRRVPVRLPDGRIGSFSSFQS